MNFEKARYNMVEQQIRPWEVLDLVLLDVLSDIPREKFVLPEQQEIAYAELSLPLQNGSIMLEPKIVARLIQALELTQTKNVLEIGTGSGYATAILAKLSYAVDTLDIDEQQQKFAKKILKDLNIQNINYYVKDGLIEKTFQDLNQKYDAIYLGGAIHSVPGFLLEALKPNGKLSVIIGDTPIMKATIFTKTDTEIIEKSIFETNVAYLQENPNTFTKRFEF